MQDEYLIRSLVSWSSKTRPSVGSLTSPTGLAARFKRGERVREKSRMVKSMLSVTACPAADREPTRSILGVDYEIDRNNEAGSKVDVQ